MRFELHKKASVRNTGVRLRNRETESNRDQWRAKEGGGKISSKTNGLDFHPKGYLDKGGRDRDKEVECARERGTFCMVCATQEGNRARYTKKAKERGRKRETRWSLSR